MADLINLNDNKKNISRDDIARTIYKEFGLGRGDGLDIVNNIIDIIIEGLQDTKNNVFHKKDHPNGIYKRGDFKCRLIKIHNFGTFILKKKRSRIGRNPKTKEEVIIKDRYVVTFKASKNVLKYLNSEL